jgi:hypothetical protein
MLVTVKYPARAQGDGFRVHGRVYSSQTGLPLSDINVSPRNTQAGPASTDSTGYFEIDLPDRNEQLVISYPGYKPKILYVSGREEVSVWLLDENELSISDEMQLIFHKQPANDVAGAASEGRNLELGYTSAQSIDQVLQGKIPGLNVTNRSGMPGEGSYMNVRGYNSLFASGLPLVVIDGMITRTDGFPNSVVHGSYQSPLAFIDINNISSITLLKDAS